LRFQDKILRKVQDIIKIRLVVYEGYYTVGKSVLYVILELVDKLNKASHSGLKREIR
jgi:hypothetical protein